MWVTIIVCGLLGVITVVLLGIGNVCYGVLLELRAVNDRHDGAATADTGRVLVVRRSDLD